MLQKSYTVDFLTKKVKTNEGKVPQYYVENNHPAIIEPELFDLVQSEIQRRGKGSSRYSGVTIFSSKVQCAECGGWYGIPMTNTEGVSTNAIISSDIRLVVQHLI